MEFRKVLALRGPNIWANFPVLEAWVDLKELKDSPSDILPGFNERVMAWLPTMIEHRCSIGERGGFFERLRRGTYQGHILEHVTLELQSLAGVPTGFGRARETSEDGVYKVAIEYNEEELCRACLETGRRLLDAAVQRSAVRRHGRSGQARASWPSRFASAPAPAPSSGRRSSGAFRFAGSTPKAWCNWAMGPGSGASWPPKPIAPAPSPKRSLKTKN